MIKSTYQSDGFYDELFGFKNKPHQEALPLIERLTKMSLRNLKAIQKAADLEHYNQGNTFNVYSDEGGVEKILPFDLIPRIITHHEWEIVETGLKQRIQALNMFIQDIYNDKKILKDKIIPKELVLSSKSYLKACEGFTPPSGIWIHITGSDLVRNETGEFFVLEDNLRCPSGISYVLENRAVLKRIFPQAFMNMNVRAISDYGDHLYAMLAHSRPQKDEHAFVVVLTPGPYNSAYFEHTYLASQMGVPLTQGSDLIVIDDVVMLKTTRGLQRVNVIYRRIDDHFLDPEFFKNDTLLGVPGLMQAYLKGNVTLANAPGTGFADDKAVYAYIPKIIKYYLDQEPIIHNVDTFLCGTAKDRKYVLENLENLVVKAVDLSGGYGMLIGPHSDKKLRDEFASKIKKNPRHYIAQPVLSLSRAPTLCKEGLEGRHVDLRPFALYGESIHIIPGGLTRVALKKGSLVVNSSQGGGSKDTWVLDKPGLNGGFLSA